VTSPPTRRGAVLRLAALAALLLVAGALPWLTAGPLPARPIAVPLLAAGVLAAAATVLQASRASRP
jgi:hypothetical protein